MDKPFLPIETPLKKGINSIEASAGTGKTFTLAILFCRLYLQYKIPLGSIVVITYTKLATQELKKRIQVFLKELQQNINILIQQKPITKEFFFIPWIEQNFTVAQYPTIQRKIDLALLSLEYLRINTIHSFCLDNLKEFPHISGLKTSSILLDDYQWHKQLYRHAQSYWLKQEKQNTNKQQLFRYCFKTTEDLTNKIPLNSIGRVLPQKINELDWNNLHPLIAQAHKKTFSQLPNEDQHSVQKIEHFFKNDFLIFLSQKTEQLFRMEKFNHNLTISKTLESLKHTKFIRNMQNRYQAFLVDEFQDTDFLQWQIISKMAKKPDEKSLNSKFIFLIGDPKQSIYKFRNADIDCYFHAKNQSKQQYSLNTNWRTDKNLIETLNKLYQRANKEKNIFGIERLQYHQATVPQDKKKLSTLDIDNTHTKPFILRTPKNCEKELKVEPATQQVLNWLKQDCLQLQQYIKEGLIKRTTNNQQPIDLSDITILIPDNQSINIISENLSSIGIPTAKELKAKIWQSRNGKWINDFLNIIKKTKSPIDTQNLKKIITLFGHSPSSQKDHSKEKDLIDDLLSRKNTVLEKEGPFAWWTYLCNHHLLGHFGFTQKNQKEQFINKIEKLFFQLQTWWGSGCKTIAELEKKIIQNHDQEDNITEQGNAIRLLTIHKAKGLESSIVICPFLWKGTPFKKSFSDYLQYDHNQNHYYIHTTPCQSSWFDEKQRLLYVALTRSEHLLITYWLPVKHLVTRQNSAYQHFLFSMILKEKNRTSEYASQIEQINNIDGITVLTEKELLLPKISKTKEKTSTTKNPTITKQKTQKNNKQLTQQYTNPNNILSFSRLSNSNHQPEQSSPQDENRNYSIDETITTQPTPTKTTTETGLKATELGNIVHSIMEQIIQPIAKQTSREILQYSQTLITQEIAKLPLNVSQSKQAKTLINHLIHALLNQPIGTQENFEISILQALTKQQITMYPEMRFDFKINQSTIRHLNQLIQLGKNIPLSTLPNQAIHQGLFTGFIDLIMIIKENIYIIDFKTNYLGQNIQDYNQQALQKSMLEHHYGWQSVIYSYAVYRWFKTYKKIINPTIQTTYLYARGLHLSNGQHGNHTKKQNLQLLQKLDTLFNR